MRMVDMMYICFREVSPYGKEENITKLGLKRERRAEAQEAGPISHIIVLNLQLTKFHELFPGSY